MDEMSKEEYKRVKLQKELDAERAKNAELLVALRNVVSIFDRDDSEIRFAWEVWELLDSANVVLAKYEKEGE